MKFKEAQSESSPESNLTSIHSSQHSIIEGIRYGFQDILQQPSHLLVLRLTAVLFLLYGASGVVLDVPVRILCGLMVLSPILLTVPGLWVILCGVIWWSNATDWLWIDNHKYLMSYWCLVCAIATSSKNPTRVLAWNGRILIGLTFLFATGWKILAGQYLDGSFLHHTFLTDSRLEAFSTRIGQLNPETLPLNYLTEVPLKIAPHVTQSITLTSSLILQRVAIATSYWTLFIEGLVAIAFLSSVPRWLYRHRDIILMIFIVTTYFLLPVLGFAYVLLAMGLAQCSPNQMKIRAGYLCLFGVLQLARLPWETYVLYSKQMTG